MNYVAFQGITQIDDLYLESEQKMKAKNEMEEHKNSVEKRLKFKKKDNLEQGWDLFFDNWQKPNEGRYIVMRIIMIVYLFFKFMYKSIYFYILPYMIIPLSFYSYVGK